MTTKQPITVRDFRVKSQGQQRSRAASVCLNTPLMATPQNKRLSKLSLAQGVKRLSIIPVSDNQPLMAGKSRSQTPCLSGQSNIKSIQTVASSTSNNSAPSRNRSLPITPDSANSLQQRVFVYQDSVVVPSRRLSMFISGNQSRDQPTSSRSQQQTHSEEEEGEDGEEKPQPLLTLHSILAAKRVSRKLVAALTGSTEHRLEYIRKISSLSSNSASQLLGQQLYRLMPEQPFPTEEMKEQIDDLLTRRIRAISHTAYSQTRAVLLGKQLCDTVKFQLKSFGPPRYIIYCVVRQRAGQETLFASSTLWFNDTDRCFTCQAFTEQIHVAVAVFAVYKD